MLLTTQFIPYAVLFSPWVGLLGFFAVAGIVS